MEKTIGICKTEVINSFGTKFFLGPAIRLSSCEKICPSLSRYYLSPIVYKFGRVSEFPRLVRIMILDPSGQGKT